MGELSPEVKTQKSLQPTSTTMDSSTRGDDTVPKIVSKSVDSYFSLGVVGYDGRMKVSANCFV